MSGADFGDRKKVDWKAIGQPKAEPKAEGGDYEVPLTGNPAEDLTRLMSEEDPWLSLGLPFPKPKYRDEAADGVSPPNDDDRILLLAWVKGEELPADVTKRLSYLTLAYKTWSDEWMRIVFIVETGRHDGYPDDVGK